MRGSADRLMASGPYKDLSQYYFLVGCCVSSCAHHFCILHLAMLVACRSLILIPRRIRNSESLTSLPCFVLHEGCFLSRLHGYPVLQRSALRGSKITTCVSCLGWIPEIWFTQAWQGIALVCVPYEGAKLLHV